MNGGPWRITVDSWITPDATWHCRRTFDVEASSLSDALRQVADAPAEVRLDPDRRSIRRGKPPKGKK